MICASSFSLNDLFILFHFCQEPAASGVTPGFLRRGLRIDLRPCQEHLAHVRDLWRCNEACGGLPLEAFHNTFMSFYFVPQEKSRALLRSLSPLGEGANKEK